MNSQRFRHTESMVYSLATWAGSRVFHAASAASTFCRLLDVSSNGGQVVSLASSSRFYSISLRMHVLNPMRTIILLSSPGQARPVPRV